MSYRYLLDTNLLIYPLDARNADKQEKAIDALQKLRNTGNAALPVQALSEFSNVALRRLQPPLPPEKVSELVGMLMQAFPVLPLTAPIVKEALRGVSHHHLSFFDAQIWASARLYQIPIVISEDFAAGANIDGVRFINPFTETF